MAKFTAYLLKPATLVVPRYVIANGSVAENPNSVFAEGVHAVNSSLLDTYFDENDVTPKPMRQSESNPNAFFRSSAGDKSPWWAGFWSIRERIKVSSADAVVFVGIGSKTIAMTHGQGRYLLNPYAIVQDFGLKTALNMIDPEKLKATDSFSPSEVAMQTHKHSGQTARLGEYDLDVYQTLLKAIAGKCREEYSELAAAIQGTDSLKFTHQGPADELQADLALLLGIYESDSYKHTVFDWVDNFRPVKDPELVARLDSMLVAKVRTRDPDITLSIPDPFESHSDCVFKFRRISRRDPGGEHLFLEIESYYAKLRLMQSEIKLENLKNHQIEVIDQGTGFSPRTHSLYRCLHWDVHLNGCTYFIENGRWYQVAMDFMGLIDDRVKRYVRERWDPGLRYDIQELKKTASQSSKSQEYIYNGRLTERLNETGVSELLDNKIVQYANGRFEICDVIYKPTEKQWYLIHNKFKYGSSALSHLFSQGYVSAHALTQRELLDAVNQKIETPSLRLPKDISPHRGNITVVYGIIGKRNRNGEITLPLFSRINLHHFAREIETLGFRLRVALIEAVSK